MKKTIILLFLFYMLSYTVYADAINITVTDIDKNVITISGDAPVDTIVTLYIFEPGKTINDLSFEDAKENGNVIQYFNKALSANGKYSFPVQMRLTDVTSETGGGEYTVEVYLSDVKYSKKFPFYFKEVKEKYLEALNNASSEDDIYEKLASIVSAFGLSDSPLYLTGDLNSITANLYKYIKTTQIPDINSVVDILKKAMILSAYNTSNAEALISQGVLLYPEETGLSNLAEYQLYLNCINNNGKKKLHEKLLAGNYEDIEDIANAFKDLVMLYAITDSNTLGSGHVADLLERYHDYYLAKGFRLTEFQSIANKTAVYDALAQANTDSITFLADLFNSMLFQETKRTSRISSGSGGLYIAPGEVVNHAETQYNEKTVEHEVYFDDLTHVDWAVEAINYLASKKIIVGKGNRLFAPDESITIGEFVKLITLAFNLKADDSESKFIDVRNSWSEPYVNAALNAGIITGVSEDRFEPDSNILREQAAMMLFKAININMDTGYTFLPEDYFFSDDYAISDYAKTAVYAMRAQGIIKGIGGNLFAPKANITRAEAAVMIYKTIQLGGQR